MRRNRQRGREKEEREYDASLPFIFLVLRYIIETKLICNSQYVIIIKFNSYSVIHKRTKIRKGIIQYILYLDLGRDSLYHICQYLFKIPLSLSPSFPLALALALFFTLCEIPSAIGEKLCAVGFTTKLTLIFVVFVFPHRATNICRANTRDYLLSF